MKHVSQKLLPFLALNYFINDGSLLPCMDHSDHRNIFNLTMKNIKNMMPVGLLMTSSIIVGSSSEYEKWKQILNQESKSFIDSRNHKKIDGTPVEKTTITLTDLSLNGAGIVMSISLCSYVVDNALVIFDATKDMPNRRTIASGACTAACTALYASFKYEEMKKAQELQKSEELKKAQALHEFLGSQVSIEVQKSLALQKDELEKSTLYYYFTNEKSIYYWLGTGCGLFSSSTK